MIHAITSLIPGARQSFTGVPIIDLSHKYENHLAAHISLMRHIASKGIDAELPDAPGRKLPKPLVDRIRYIVNHGKSGIVTLEKTHLDTFKVMQDSLDHELGGYIDFGKNGEVDFVQTFFGDDLSVDIRNYASIEVCWHTHTYYHDNRPFSPPSPADLISSFEEFEITGAQIQLVFTREGTYVFWPRVSALLDYYTGKWGERRINEEFRTFQKLFDEACETADMRRFNEHINDIGFELFLVPWGKRLNLAFFVVPDHTAAREKLGMDRLPRRPRKRARRGKRPFKAKVVGGYRSKVETLFRSNSKQ